MKIAVKAARHDSAQRVIGVDVEALDSPLHALGLEVHVADGYGRIAILGFLDDALAILELLDSPWTVAVALSPVRSGSLQTANVSAQSSSGCFCA